MLDTIDSPPTEPAPSMDARMVRTRAALLESLLGLLEEKSFDQVTIREIAKRAGIGYATFFRHYPTKEALLDALAADQIQTLFDMTLPVFQQKDQQASTRLLVQYVYDHRKLWSALLTGGAGGIMREAFLRLALELPKEVESTHPPTPSWLPAELRVIVGASGSIEALSWWLRQGDTISVEQMADIIDRLVITPSIAPMR